MNVREAYIVLQRASGIKVGDKVRCLRHFEKKEMGSSIDHSRHTQKAAFIDDKAVGVITEVDETSLWVNCGSDYGCGWSFPFFALEIVGPVKKMITVAGKEYSESTLARAMQEYVG